MKYNLPRNLYYALSEMREYNNLLKLLLEIRKTVNHFRNVDDGTVLRITAYFEHLNINPNLSRIHIIDVILNIIASYTEDEHFFGEGEKLYHSLPLLDDLLNLGQKEESANERIFEILCNMYTKSNSLARLIMVDAKPKFVEHALELLKAVSKDDASAQRDISEATLLVIVQFLRIILEYSPIVVGPFVKASGVLKVVGSFFVYMTLKMNNNGEILQKVVELIDFYSEYTFHRSINETTGGESIMYLCARMRLFPRRIPRIMENVMEIEQLGPRPQHPDICDWITQKLEALKIEDSKDEYVGYISCLCFMLLDRCSDQHKQFLPQLLKVLKFIENPSYADMECFILILVTLNKHYWSDVTLVKGDLLDCHIVQTLIDKLKWVSGAKTLTLDFEHQMVEKMDRSEYSKRPNFLEGCNHPNPTFKEEYSCVTHSLSASSSKGEMHWSDHILSFPWSSESDPSTAMLAVNELNCACSEQNLIDTMKGMLLTEMAKLIENYIRVHPNVPEMASEELFIALLNCSVRFGQTHLYGYSASILIGSPDYLALFMKTTVVQKIYGMSKFQHNSSCVICNELTKFAHCHLTCFEKATMAHMGTKKIREALETDQGERKARLILTIPYIVSKKSLLAQLFFDFDGLKILMQLLKDGSPLRKRCIEVIYILASQRLDITDPSKVDIAGPPQVDIAGPSAPIKTALTEERLVTFVLDDGTSLQANRNLLTKKSWYFSVLLDGNFKEKEEKEVALHNVQRYSLKFVLHLLKHPETIDQLVMVFNLDLLLDAISLTNWYGQNELCDSLMNRVVKYRMAPKTVSAIYCWSFESHLGLLREEAVIFAMVHCVEDNARIAMFETLLKSKHADELFEDIQTILERHLKPLRNSTGDS